MVDLLTAVFSLAFLAQMLRITVPYALTALGGSLSERSGVINIALEGKMLVGAFTAMLGAHFGARIGLALPVAVLSGALGGAVVAALYALVVIRFRADQIVAGVAINMMAYALTRYVLTLVFGSGSNSPRVQGFEGHVLANPVFWLACGLVLGVWAMVRHTAFGLRLRAVGEHPEAAETAGVSVERVRWGAVLLAGSLAGLGGAWLSLSESEFVAEMSSGRGYIALAAVIMGGWRPAWAVAACLLFGFAEAIQNELQASNIGIPEELVSTFPYVLTMVVLAGFIGRSRAPSALGVPHERG